MKRPVPMWIPAGAFALVLGAAAFVAARAETKAEVTLMRRARQYAQALVGGDAARAAHFHRVAGSPGRPSRALEDLVARLEGVAVYVARVEVQHTGPQAGQEGRVLLAFPRGTVPGWYDASAQKDLLEVVLRRGPQGIWWVVSG